jgi:3-methyladenine DNA glycosylase AlkD
MKELLREVRAQLASQADPRFREGLQWYFKEAVDPYGVRTPAVRKIAAEAWRRLKTAPVAQLNRFCEALWKSRKMEEGSIAIFVYRRLGKQCAETEFQLFEKWVDRYVRNWAHCDGVSAWLLSACLENDPRLIPRLYKWTASSNRWKRRAAAVSLLREANQGRNTAAILSVAAALIEDADDMVQKGVGWVLKETYPRRPREVMQFLKKHQADVPRLLLRIAAEKMTPLDRAVFLAGRRKAAKA